jgi:CheY-like chemotaxis protein
VVDGPHVVLRPKLAQTLALALHELATNAVKYGALSSLTGGVEVTWELTATDLVLRWTESGGPTTKKAVSPGFGMRIILASIEGQLAGRAKFDWRPEGLQCAMSVPLSDEMVLSETTGTQRSADNPASSVNGTPVVSANRIMIVEDETLVAMSLAELVEELGFSVIGPFGRVRDATTALKDGGIDAAILDVNLGGEMVYPLADVLREGRVPFVFMTGYGAESIERRFANVPVLQKPVEPQALRGIFTRLGDLNAAVH